MKPVESIGFGTVAVSFRGCGETENWDSRMEETLTELIHETGFDGELGLVKADVITEFVVKDFHAILIMRNRDGKSPRFCYVLEFDLMCGMTLSMIASLMATSIVSIIVSHYFDNRDTGYLATCGVKVAKAKFPDAMLET